MKLTIRELREFIWESLAGSDPSEAYSHELVDDNAFKQQSTYVPDDIKGFIKNYFEKMGLSSKSKQSKIG